MLWAVIVGEELDCVMVLLGFINAKLAG